MFVCVCVCACLWWMIFPDVPVGLNTKSALGAVLANHSDSRDPCFV